MAKKEQEIASSSLESLFSYFKKIKPLKIAEKNEIASRLQERKIRRRQYLLQEGDVCRHYSFVVSGCFRMFSVDKKGVSYNLQFAAENEWIADIGSFYSEKQSKLYIEAVEPATILQIEKKDLLYLFINYHMFDRNFRVIIENKFVELQNRVLQNISSTAEERYVAFLDQYPALSMRLPSVHIASYLGITPEFLSKIRKDLAGRG
jgi:CRP/FNR family transcriptional regulator, anaerobic regulatory protein